VRVRGTYGSILSEVVEARHVQRELLGLGELTEAHAQREQLLLAHVGGELHDSFADIEHSFFVKTEAVWIIGSFE